MKRGDVRIQTHAPLVEGRVTRKKPASEGRSHLFFGSTVAGKKPKSCSLYRCGKSSLKCFPFCGLTDRSNEHDDADDDHPERQEEDSTGSFHDQRRLTK